MRRITAITLAAFAIALTFAASDPASAGGGCHNGVFSDEANTQVELTKNCFAPTVVRVQPGDTVTWNNGDPEIHAVTGAANIWGTDDKVHPGESVTYRFDNTGVFPYFCFFHPSMVGTVVVGDGGAASASTAKNSIKAVSAEVPGGEVATDEPAEVVEDDGSGVGTVPIALGVGIVAAIGGFAGALFLRRRAQ
jgi:plastocyanin